MFINDVPDMENFPGKKMNFRLWNNDKYHRMFSFLPRNKQLTSQIIKQLHYYTVENGVVCILNLEMQPNQPLLLTPKLRPKFKVTQFRQVILQ